MFVGLLVMLIEGFCGVIVVGFDVVVFDVLEGLELCYVEVVLVVGLFEWCVYVWGVLFVEDCVVVLVGVLVFVVSDFVVGWLWWVIEVMVLGVLVVVVDSGLYGDVIVDGGMLVVIEDFVEVLFEVVNVVVEWLCVFGFDCVRVFFWVSLVECFWGLYVDF